MTSMNGLLVFVLGMCTSSYWCLFSVCYGLPPSYLVSTMSIQVCSAVMILSRTVV